MDDRRALAALSRAARAGVIALPAAAKALRVPRDEVAAKLGTLARQGWLQRLRRGLYLVRPLGSFPDESATPEDPWVLAREVFSPCYIGGWSAGEYWNLTEQIFRSTLVVTAASARTTEVTIGGHDFRVFRVSRSRLTTGVSKVWRGTERVDVSGLERTLVDAARDPSLVGGGRHFVQVFLAYRDHDRRDTRRLLDVAQDAATGAAWKRLGFLAERLWPDETGLVAAARDHLSAGYVRLDPGIARRGRLSKRWGLSVNIAESGLDRHIDRA